MNHSLLAENIDFSYRGAPVLRGLHLCVPAGALYGFLGLNGAGKSTTMRLLLGLLRPRAGRVALLGQVPGPAVYGRVGSLVENPPLYSHLSGAGNLEVSRRYRRVASGRIAAVLEIVGLDPADRRPVRAYSTGMRQRLGLALALLHDPEVLLLDEPTNGLDPAGQAQLRRLLVALNREQGKTILLCTHSVYEVQQCCTHVGVLHGGRMVFEGPVGEFARRAQQVVYVFEVDDARRALALCPGGEVLDAHTLRVPLERREAAAGLVAALVGAGVAVYRAAPAEEGLEAELLRLVGQPPRADASEQEDDASGVFF